MRKGSAKVVHSVVIPNLHSCSFLSTFECLDQGLCRALSTTVFTYPQQQPPFSQPCSTTALCDCQHYSSLPDPDRLNQVQARHRCLFPNTMALRPRRTTTSSALVRPTRHCHPPEKAVRQGSLVFTQRQLSLSFLNGRYLVLSD